VISVDSVDPQKRIRLVICHKIFFVLKAGRPDGWQAGLPSGAIAQVGLLALLIVAIVN